MIFGGPIFTTIAQRLGVRKTLAFAFGLWPLLVAVVLSGTSTLVLPACVVLGFLFSALPILITVYVVENTTAADYGPSFAAATLAFGIAQTIAPPIGGAIADQSGTFLFVFLLSAAASLIGLAAALRSRRSNRPCGWSDALAKAFAQHRFDFRHLQQRLNAISDRFVQGSKSHSCDLADTVIAQFALCPDVAHLLFAGLNALRKRICDFGVA